MDDDQDLPKDAVAVKQVLDSMNVRYEPRVLHYLIDFTYNHVHATLQDADAFAEYVGRPPGEVQLEDVVRAMESQDTTTFAAPPPLDTLMELAEQRNSERLPQPKPNVHGLRLPPEAASLVAPNYQLRPPEPPS